MSVRDGRSQEVREPRRRADLCMDSHRATRAQSAISTEICSTFCDRARWGRGRRASASNTPDERCCSGQVRHENVHERSVEGRSVRRHQQRAHDTQRRTSPRMKHVPHRCVAQRSESPSRSIAMMLRYLPARVDARSRFLSSHVINSHKHVPQ